MSKVLGHAGVSLADVYDVEGSIAGVEELDANSVKTVHEMGGTIFSERLSARITNITSGALAQNLTFDVSFSVTEISRFIALSVITTDAARVSVCQVSITTPALFGATDSPVWAWDTSDTFRTIRVLLGGTVQTRELLVALRPPLLPSMLTREDSPRLTNTVTLRGLTTGFGAGTVTTSLLMHFLFPERPGLSSKGLPIPGW